MSFNDTDTTRVFISLCKVIGFFSILLKEESENSKCIVFLTNLTFIASTNVDS